jgi:hypothetical protein
LQGFEMEIRELLRYEIWSKETSRKALARTTKIVARIGIVTGILVLAIGIVLTVALRWLTPGERRAARVALSSVDSLQDFGAVSDGDFDAGLIQARAKIQVAQDSVWTLRDAAVADWLWDYWIKTESYRKQKQDMETERRTIGPAEWGSDRWIRRDPNKAGDQDRAAVRSELHKILD